MQFFLIFSLLMALAFGAPQDLVTEPSAPIAVYEETGPEPTEVTQSYAPVVASEANTYKDEYVGKDPEPTVVYEEVTYEPTPASHPIPDETPEGRPMHKQTVILNAGKHLSEAITAKIVGPVVIFNSKVAAAAGALPPMLAAKGAVIGSAIATPIEIGAVAGSSIVSGVTGKLVALPISVATGAVAKFVGAAEEGKHIWEFNVAHGGEILKDGVIKIGHIILKPIAVIVGAQTALTGAGLGIAGTGIKGVGVGMEAVGGKMVAKGLVAKGIGHRLIAAQFPPYWKK